MKIAKAIQNCTPLSDVLQMKMLLNERKGMPLRLVGDMACAIQDGVLNIPAEVKVVASTVNEKEAWVLVHVVGELYVLAAYVSDAKEVYFWVVDGGALGFSELILNKTYDGVSVLELVDKLSKGCKAIYRCARGKNAKWVRVDDNAGDLDGGPGGIPQEERRQASQASRS